MKKALVCGAGGFIGGHLVKRLKKEGYWVRGVDLVHHEYAMSEADDFVIGDLRDPKVVTNVIGDSFDEVYQLAADMGGGFVFTGENDVDIMHNSAIINLNVALECKEKVKKVFYSSSACMYFLSITKMTLIILNVQKTLLTPQHQIVSMDGKNCSVKGYIRHLKEIMV